jgi:hypothetical protein
VILGAGAAGLASVLALTGRLPGHDPITGSILLLEQATVGHGSSLENPGRGQGGFHYPDIATAEALQDLLADNLIRYPDRFTTFLSRTQDGSLGHSWYALLPDRTAHSSAPRSIFPSDQSRRLFEHLSARWDQMRRVQPVLESLGDGPFGQWVEPERAAAVLGTRQYERVAMTLEPSLEVPRFMAALRRDALADPRVTLHEHDRVLAIRRPGRTGQGARFLLDTVQDGRVTSIAARNLNVCAWEATEELLAPLGYQFDTLNRIKRAFRLRLGEGSARFPSTMAVYGSHAMFRNFYDGTGFATVGDLSNVNTRRLEHTEQALQDHIAHPDEVDAKTLPAQAVAALQRYFPALDVAEVVDIVYGCVKIFS